MQSLANLFYQFFSIIAFILPIFLVIFLFIILCRGLKAIESIQQSLNNLVEIRKKEHEEFKNETT